jgi:hypothetical protein
LPWHDLDNRSAAMEVVRGGRTEVDSHCAPALRGVIRQCWATELDFGDDCNRSVLFWMQRSTSLINVRLKYLCTIQAARAHCALALRGVIRQCWATELNARPTMAEVCAMLDRPFDQRRSCTTRLR